MLHPKIIAKCSYKALVDTIEHDGIEHAGYLAFLALLSLFPFLVFFFAIVGFFGQTEIGLRLINVMLDNNLVPSNILPGLEPRIEEIASGPPQGLLTIAIIGAVWTASSAVDGLRTILNRAYRVGTPPAYIFRRLMSIAEFFVLTVGVILVTFLLIVAPNIWEGINHLLHFEQIKQFFDLENLSISPLWDILRYLITVLILLAVVMALHFILPNTKQNWKALFPGAAVVVFLWFITGFLFSNYLSRFEQVNILYGSLGGVIAALLFFYFTAMIFIYGAEFNYALTQAKGQKIEEKEKV